MPARERVRSSGHRTTKPQRELSAPRSVQVVDFYGAAAGMCAIMIATEGVYGIFWAAGTLTLGCVVPLSYMVWKLHTGSVRLTGKGEYSPML